MEVEREREGGTYGGSGTDKNIAMKIRGIIWAARDDSRTGNH